MSEQGVPSSLTEAFAGVSDLSRPSVSALRPVSHYIADVLNRPLEDVYAISVSAIRNLRKQADQSERGRGARVLVAVFRDADLVALTRPKAPQILGRGGRDAIVTIVVSGNGPDVRAVYEPRDGDVFARLVSVAPAAVRQVVERSGAAEIPLVQRVETKVDTTPAFVPVVETVARGRLVIDQRIRRMLQLAIAASRAVMLVGPPGTGKTTLLREAIAEAQASPELYGLSAPPNDPILVTPEESWTARELIGGETVDDQARIRFRPGYLLEALSQNRWLFLDEANRADMDRIFGALLTWLSGNAVTVGRGSGGRDGAEIRLDWDDSCIGAIVAGEARLDEGVGTPIRYVAGSDWRLLGTYNALDAHRVFRFGQALGRRFARVPVPAIDAVAFEQALEPRLAHLTGSVSTATLSRIEETISGLYELHLDVRPVVGPALFLDIAEYVARGLALAPEVDLIDDMGDDPVSDLDAKVDVLLAEGYLIGAGPLLAHLEPEVLDGLRSEIVMGRKLISAEQWTFIQEMLPALS